MAGATAADRAVAAVGEAAAKAAVARAVGVKAAV